MFQLIILLCILQMCFLWTLFPLTFQIFPEPELDTKGKYLSPPKVFPLQEQKKKIQAQWAKTQRMVQWWRRKVKFIFFSSSWNIRSFNPFFFMLLNSWTSCSDGNWSKLGRVCGLFTLAEWVSSVCKEPWLLMSPTFLCRHLRSPECFTSRFKAKNDGADGD